MYLVASISLDTILPSKISAKTSTLSSYFWKAYPMMVMAMRYLKAVRYQCSPPLRSFLATGIAKKSDSGHSSKICRLRLTVGC